tara:strand:- start:1149 stop:1991 length:843 start_codon:yes stop_codon:yes gene_type:complete
MNKQFNTMGLSYDRVFSVYGQELSAGFQFVNDRSSIGNLMQNKLMFSGGCNKLIKGNYISGGIQLGMLHKGLDPNKYSYPEQWDENIGEFTNQTGIGNAESFTSTNEYLFDFNLGLSWARQITDKLFPEIGIAFFHINRPEESFFGNPENLEIRHAYNVRLNYKLSSKYIISPNLLYSFQNNAQDMIMGFIAKMKMQENKSKINNVFAGLNFRDGFDRNYDAANVIIGATREEWQVGLSYDINISNLSSITHYRGAFELSVIYIAQSSEPKIYNVPCDRY